MIPKSLRWKVSPDLQVVEFSLFQRKCHVLVQIIGLSRGTGQAVDVHYRLLADVKPNSFLLKTQPSTTFKNSVKQIYKNKKYFFDNLNMISPTVIDIRQENVQEFLINCIEMCKFYQNVDGIPLVFFRLVGQTQPR